jgi:serine 3-dehydrogenase
VSRDPAAAQYNPRMDKTALITGATSGFGRAAVERFVAGGWRVVACGRRAERLQALVDALGAGKVHAAAFDVRDELAMQAALTALPPGFRDVDLLVNNAGLALGTRPAQDASLDDWRTMIDTNVVALVTLTRALLPSLIARRGAIVNVSSTAGKYPYTALEPGMAETEFTLVRTHGDQAASDALYAGANPMTATDIAETIWWVANLPPHLNVNRLEIMPASQSFAGFQVARS